MWKSLSPLQFYVWNRPFCHILLHCYRIMMNIFIKDSFSEFHRSSLVRLQTTESSFDIFPPAERLRLRLFVDNWPILKAHTWRYECYQRHSSVISWCFVLFSLRCYITPNCELEGEHQAQWDNRKTNPVFAFSWSSAFRIEFNTRGNTSTGFHTALKTITAKT